MQKRKIDELISCFNRKVADMDIDREYKMELLGMITAIGFACEKELPIEPERKMGKWIECDHEKWSGGTFAYICSECGGAYHLNIEQTIAVWNFCPNCGAKMEEGDADV